MAAAGVGGGLLGGDGAVLVVTARCTPGAALDAGGPAEATGATGTTGTPLDACGVGEPSGAAGEAVAGGEAVVVTGNGWAGAVGTADAAGAADMAGAAGAAGVAGLAPVTGEGPASPATTGTARCTRIGSGAAIVGRELSGTACSGRGTAARCSPTG
ncbi:hypothetical protein [Streptomyces sp. NPDC050263]|uniref:hypothetical protein n=1 Tax=Streptomyces sp. NPDC050263 TaxID=3155037 RepID=UPI00343E29CF